MEEDKKINTEQIENKELDKTETVGNILKRKRKELKLSLDDVSSYLKIKKFYLEAIENNEFNNLPGNTYVIGFIKSYASFLKLDQKMLVELYKYVNNTFVDNKKDDGQDENVVIKDPVINTNHLILILLVVLFVLVIVAIVKFNNRHEDTDIKPETKNVELLLNSEKKDDDNLKSDDKVELLLDDKEKESSSVIEKIDENNLKVSDDVKSLEIEKNQHESNLKEEKEQKNFTQSFKEYGIKDKQTSKIVLKFTKDNWIKLKKGGLYKYDEKLGDIGDGITIFEGVLKSGDIYYIPDEAGYYLTIGNAQGVDIVVNNHVIEPLSKYEVSRHNIEMNVEKLLNRTAYKRN